MKDYNEIAKRVLERRDEYEEKKQTKRRNTLQISTAVLCLVLMTVAGFAVVRRNWLKTQFLELLPFQSTTVTMATQAPTDDTAHAVSSTRPPKDTSATESDSASQSTTVPSEIYNELAWEDRSMPGKFRTLGINNSQNLNAIDESDISGSLKEYVYPFGPREERATLRQGDLLVSGVQIEGSEPDGTVHTTLIDIFSLSGLSEDLALGVRFPDDDRIYIYVCSSYIPATLGEFMDAIEYDNTVTYGAITLFQGNNFPVNNQNAKDIKSYLLSDREVLNITDADGEATGQCVTVSISCSELGRNYKVLNIYEDGHITTNLIGYEYSFFIGKDAVDNFLKNSYNITFEEIRQVSAETTIPEEEWTTAPTTAPARDYSQVTPANEDDITDTTILQANTQAFAVSDADISVVVVENETVAEITAVTE